MYLQVRISVFYLILADLTFHAFSVIIMLYLCLHVSTRPRQAGAFTLKMSTNCCQSVQKWLVRS